MLFFLMALQLVQAMSIQAKSQSKETPFVVHSEMQIPDLEPCYLGVRLFFNITFFFCHN